MQQLSQYRYSSAHSFSAPRTGRSLSLTKIAVDFVEFVRNSITASPIKTAVELPEAWRNAESIQSIITSWAGIDSRRAHTLSQISVEHSSQIFSFRNKTLGDDCQIILTRDSSAPMITVDQAADSSTVHSLVTEFLARLPACTRHVSKAANPWIYVDLILPPDRCAPMARVLGACFFIWLCIVDDLTEDGDEHGDLDACLRILSATLYDATPDPPRTPCLEVMETFKQVVATVQFDDLTLSGSECVVEEWKSDFWKEMQTCCQAWKAEQHLHGRRVAMREWLAQRIITICTRPFMVLFRKSCNLSTDLSRPLAPALPTLRQLQLLFQALLGLQNDILGWEKDHRQGNPLNAVEVLISHGTPMSEAFHTVLDAHNDLMRLYVVLVKEYLSKVRGPQKEQTEAYVALLTNCGHAMATWMMKCGRYIPDADVREIEVLPA